MARPDDRELEALLADLDETLDRLRTELDGTDEPVRRRREPPTVGELVRFTEEYTIPTTIAALEAAVAALELLQGLLGLVTRGGREARSLGGASEAAGSVVSELRRALREIDLPDDPETRDVVQEARDLTETVERRIEESGEDDRETGDARTRGVAIDVNEAEEGEEAVEAELREIREELDDQDAT
jgi:hypothetical protein